MSVAQQIIDGEVCQSCGVYFDEPAGYPCDCAACSGGSEFDKEADKARRAANRERGFNALADAGYAFEVKNGAAHLIVDTDQGKVDFWPGTEKWIARATRQKGFGAAALMQAFKPGSAPAARPILPVATEVTDHYAIVWKAHMSAFTIAAYEKAGYTITGKP